MGMKARRSGAASRDSTSAISPHSHRAHNRHSGSAQRSCAEISCAKPPSHSGGLCADRDIVLTPFHLQPPRRSGDDDPSCVARGISITQELSVEEETSIPVGSKPSSENQISPNDAQKSHAERSSLVTNYSNSAYNRFRLLERFRENKIRMSESDRPLSRSSNHFGVTSSPIETPPPPLEYQRCPGQTTILAGKSAAKSSTGSNRKLQSARPAIKSCRHQDSQTFVSL